MNYNKAYKQFLKKIILSEIISSEVFFHFRLLKEISIMLSTFALIRSQYWESDELKEIQLKKIQSIVFHANQKVNFWQNTLKKLHIKDKEDLNWEQFYKIPVIQKKDLTSFTSNYFLDNTKIASLWSKRNIKTRMITQGKTSGSTSEPLVFFQDHNYEIKSLSISRRMILAAGGEKLLPIISVRPQFRRGFSNKKIFWFFVYNYNHLKYKVDDLYTFSKKIKSPFIIYGFSSYMIELARLCYEKNIPLQPKSVITTGESLSVQEKVYIEKRLNTEVFNFYATQELGRLAFDCKYHNLHINSEYAYIEIVDKNGNNVADGCEGRVVVTTFDNKIMPFIRYDNGDIGSINNSKCPCGRNLPQLKVIGRHNHIIELPDGKRVPFLDTIYIFQTHTKIQQYQLIQIDQKKFIIKIIFENGLLQQAKENILFDITNRLYKILHKEITVTFDEVLEIEPTHNGKKIVFKTLIKK